MNKQLILIVSAVVIVGMLLIGALWDWVTVLAVLIGLSLFTIIVLGRYTLLKLYLGTYALRTILYTNPFSAMLYSVIDPHRRNNSSDLDDLFPSKKTQKPQESEELPPFHFAETVEEEQRENKTRVPS